MKKAKLSKTKIKLGNTRTGKKESYWKIITPKLGGGSTRRFFKDEVDADSFLEQQEIQIKNYGVAGASMDERLRGDALAAAELLKPFGQSLLSAAQYFTKHLAETSGGIPLNEGLELLLKAREKAGKSIVYQKSLRHRLTPFVRSFAGVKSTRQVTVTDVDNFLDQLIQAKRKPGTIESYRKDIQTLFSFLQKKGFCVENPAKDIERAKIDYKIEILTPEQCNRLLNACDAETLPSIAIGMFCGLRTSEIERLNWKNIELDESRIVIDASMAKTSSRRVVPIPEACKEWISPYAQVSGPVQPDSFRNKRDLVRVRAGFVPSFMKRDFRPLQNLLKEVKAKGTKLEAWPQNCLRHGAISYALAECGDESRVASWAGNSPSMIKKHYNAQAKKSDAVKFYAIRPSVPENVIGMKSAAA